MFPQPEYRLNGCTWRRIRVFSSGNYEVTCCAQPAFCWKTIAVHRFTGVRGASWFSYPARIAMACAANDQGSCSSGSRSAR